MEVQSGKRRWVRKLVVNVLPPVVFFLVVWFLYHRALGLAFFWDDPWHFRWIQDHSFVEIFQQGYFYYRPLVFAFWKVVLDLFGYQKAWLHLINVLVHILNGVLVWVLVRLVSKKEVLSLVTAFLFVSYPFSYQAVAYTGALFHPAVALFVLVSVLTYERFWRSRNRTLLLLSHLSLILAFLSHESAFVAPVLQVLADVRRKQRTPWTLFAVTIAAFIMWLTIPKGVGIPIQPPLTIARNTFFALRAVFYPLIPLLTPLPSWGRTVGFLLLCGIALMLTLQTTGRSSLRPLLELAFLWIGCFSLPVVLLMQSSYLREDHRLFYVASVGIALLWGSIISTPIYAIRRRGWAPVISLILVGLLFAQSSRFIQDRIRDYERASALVKGMVHAAEQTAGDQEIIYVNLPQFFAPQGSHALTSPEIYGFREVLLLLPYTSLRDLLLVNQGPPRQVKGVFLKELKPQWLAFGEEVNLDKLRTLLQERDVFLFDPSHWDFVHLSTYWFPSMQAGVPTGSHLADPVFFGERIALEGAQVEWGKEVRVTLWWRCLKPVEKSYTVFTHLYDAEGHLVAQHDGIPVRGTVPTTLWRPGDLIRDVHFISVPDGLRAGRYTLAVGLYDFATMQRLPAVSQGGHLFQDDRVPLEEREYPW